MAALSGAAVGGSLGGIAGALIGLGIPEYEAKKYEGKLQSGNCLISVHTESSQHLDQVTKIFEAGGGEDISSSWKPHKRRKASFHKLSVKSRKTSPYFFAEMLLSAHSSSQKECLTTITS